MSGLEESAEMVGELSHSGWWARVRQSARAIREWWADFWYWSDYADLDAIRQSYDELPEAPWFREVYEGKSMGEVVQYDGDPFATPTTVADASAPPDGALPANPEPPEPRGERQEDRGR